MTKRALWALPAFLLTAAPLALAEKCLQLVVHPVRYDEAQVREQDVKNGFSAAIEAYERQWKREPFSLGVGDAILSGEIVENPAAEGRRAVIFCHGHTVNRYAALKYADIFYRAGWSLLLYDQRYFGRSTGDCCTLGQKEAEDLARIFAFARERFGPGCRIGLHGESMGAATALLALKRLRPAFVVADCPFADSEELFAQWIRKNLHLPAFPVLPLFEAEARRRYGYLVRETSPAAALRESLTPVCLMHGREDTLIPCSHSEELFALCRNKKSELHLFDGADHAQSIVSDPAGYEKLLLSFLNTIEA